MSEVNLMRISCLPDALENYKSLRRVDDAQSIVGVFAMVAEISL